MAAVQWAQTVSEPGELPMPAIDTNDDACIFYTSEPQGVPKVLSSLTGVAHNIMNVAAMGGFLARLRLGPRGAPRRAGVSASRDVLVAASIHVTANNCVMHGAT